MGVGGGSIWWSKKGITSTSQAITSSEELVDLMRDRLQCQPINGYLKWGRGNSAKPVWHTGWSRLRCSLLGVPCLGRPGRMHQPYRLERPAMSKVQSRKRWLILKPSEALCALAGRRHCYDSSSTNWLAVNMWCVGRLIGGSGATLPNQRSFCGCECVTIGAPLGWRKQRPMRSASPLHRRFPRVLGKNL